MARSSRWLAAAYFVGQLHCAAEPPVPIDGSARTDAIRTDATRADIGADTARTDAGSPLDTARDAVLPPRDTGTRDVPVAPVDAPPADPYDTARDNCVAEINRYRAMNSLPPYLRWRDGESCADQMAVNDARVGIAHDGFQRAICSPRGSGQNECPRWGGPESLNSCLAQMWAEGPSADGSFDAAHGHYLNMIGDYTYMGFRQHFTQVACGFSAGGWMVQNFQ